MLQIESNIVIYHSRNFEVNIIKNDKVIKQKLLRNEKTTATVSWVQYIHINLVKNKFSYKHLILIHKYHMSLPVSRKIFIIKFVEVDVDSAQWSNHFVFW